MMQGLERSKEDRHHYVSYLDTGDYLINSQSVNRSLMVAGKMQKNTVSQSQMITDDILNTFGMKHL